MNKENSDIQNISDIKGFVDRYYDDVIKDVELSKILKKLSRKKWRFDKDSSYAFWNKLIFAEGNYSAKPFEKRVPVLINDDLFLKAFQLFKNNIDCCFNGENAELTKKRAFSIVDLFQNKLKYVKPKRIRRTNEQIRKDNEDKI